MNLTISNTQPAVALQSAAPKAAKTVVEAGASKAQSATDTFENTVKGWGAGSTATAMLGGAGTGVMVYMGMKEAPAFHRALFTLLGAGGGAAAGAVIGGLGGAVAGAMSETKSGGAMAGGATGAVAGAIAGTALTIKSGKGLDLKMVAGVAAIGAALGAVGGFSSASIKN